MKDKHAVVIVNAPIVTIIRYLDMKPLKILLLKNELAANVPKVNA